MKGLVNTSIIITVLIAIGIGGSIFMDINLNDRLTASQERGYENGYDYGYKTGLLEGNSAGFQEGSKSSYEKGNGADDGNSESGFYFVYNPTYDEVLKLLDESEMSSAQEINNYAEATGIRTAYVRSLIAEPASKGMIYIYELIAFETVDKGLVIIEPWLYREVKVEIGRSYSETNGFSTPDYDDTITKVTIVW